MSTRRGFLLAEALCALALAGVLAVACAGALVHARRLLGAAESRARAQRGGLEAMQVVAAIARDADSIDVLGDTAIELQLRIGDGVVCARDGTALYLPPSRSDTAHSLLSLSQAIEIGDEVRAWVEDSIAGFHAWVSASIDSVTARTGEVPCGSAGGFVALAEAGEDRPRLVMTTIDARIHAGTPVRIGRRGRLALYSAGGGEWMLGWRRCANGACGTVQPVAGPLRSRAAGGFAATWLAGGVLEVRVGVPGIAGQLSMPLVRTDAGR